MLIPPEILDKPLPPQTQLCRILTIDSVTADTRVITVENNHFSFKAGQYAFVQFEGFEARPYSIACAPNPKTLEFHIKNTGHGASNHASTILKPGDEVTVTAPFGDNYLRYTDKPLIVIGGGLGIAPMKAIIDAALDLKLHIPIYIFYGVRKISDLYLETHFLELAKKNNHIHYYPVVSDLDHDESLYQHGNINHCLGKKLPAHLADYQAYLAGPFDMIEHCANTLLDKGISLDMMHSDAFQTLNIKSK